MLEGYTVALWPPLHRCHESAFTCGQFRSLIARFRGTRAHVSSPFPAFDVTLSATQMVGYDLPMQYLHTMVRVSDLDTSLKFFCDGLGLKEVSRKSSERGRFTLVFLAAPRDVIDCDEPVKNIPMIELTHNWDPEEYKGGRNFGHLAYAVDDIYALCTHLMGMGVTINRPPRDGHMAFVRSPDGISVELLQKGNALPPSEPWLSMPNSGSW
jgi:lactoylglutathione lyase